jgi:oxaloacetate decarboxylase beta subunit
MDIANLFRLLQAPMHLTWKAAIMMIAGGVLIYLAIAKDYEPVLLLPIGFGAILTNLPLTGIADEHGMLGILYRAGIATELFPLLIFLLNEAASIGIIGAIDGPTAIYVSTKLAPHLLGPIAVAAYSYMALVPIIQPPVMRLMTTDTERKVRMPYTQRGVSRTTRILFPIVVTIIVSLLAPVAAPLIAMLMFGNLMRESLVVDRLSQSAQNEIANVTTIFLGLTIGATMTGESFIRLETLFILGIGLLAFVLDTVGGVLFGKLMYLFSGGTFNPLIGAAGISAFPMSARVVQRVGQEYDFDNFLLMHAMGANTAGQLGSVVAGGVVLAMLTGLF